MEVNDEKYNKALEWLGNASYNCDQVRRAGMFVVPMIKEQIENAMKYLRNEEIDDGVVGKE